MPSDPFGTTAQLAQQGIGSISEAILNIAGLYAQRKQKEREMQQEEATKGRLLEKEYQLKQKYPDPFTEMLMKQWGLGRGLDEQVTPDTEQQKMANEQLFNLYDIPQDERNKYEIVSKTQMIKGIPIPVREPQLKKLSANIEKQQKSLTSARQIIEKLRTMLDEIPASSGFLARLRGSQLRGEAFLGTNPQAATYERLRKAVFGQMAKVVSGETGRLTDQDIARIESAIPSLLSTKEERELSFQALEDILKESEITFGLEPTANLENEEDIQFTMQKHGLSREEVLRRLER